ncbi:hypothetical protein BDV96DRAFT_602269 [Lophiotrema nucula]|uniref:Uncharacterized protein n=1 Tax=Lophiotrema nucula TaxID=690887 RepID=A0A6A5YZV8_9PLEO|nr:hypothetical protein BDV96DRAFT_602269 [Lophiotrema nucula]
MDVEMSSSSVIEASFSMFGTDPPSSPRLIVNPTPFNRDVPLQLLTDPAFGFHGRENTVSFSSNHMPVLPSDWTKHLLGVKKFGMRIVWHRGNIDINQNQPCLTISLLYEHTAAAPRSIKAQHAGPFQLSGWKAHRSDKSDKYWFLCKNIFLRRDSKMQLARLRSLTTASLSLLLIVPSLTTFVLAKHAKPTQTIVPYYPESFQAPSYADPTSEEYGEALVGLAARDVEKPNNQWVALSRTHHHHVNKRDSLQELFQPSNEILFDYVDPETGKIHSYTWSHDKKSYVNLKHLQSHGRLLPGRQLCVGPDASNRTTLNLDFDDFPGYATAKKLWNRDDLLFVIEDESCYEGRGLRSVCQGNKITLNDQKLQMEIEAQHKTFWTPRTGHGD